jgi:hypothetical protein
MTKMSARIIKKIDPKNVSILKTSRENMMYPHASQMVDLI